MESDPLPSESTRNGSQSTVLIQNSHKDIQAKASVAVYMALSANVGIGLVKLTAGLLSNSSAMISEAMHSFADGFNSLCLVLGLKLGNKPADEHHPFGYGLETTFWAAIASVFMLGSAIFSIYLGFNRLLYNHDIEDLILHYFVILGALIISLILEAWAVNSASNAIVAELNIKYENLFSKIILAMQNIHNVKSPTTRFVWYEDTAAFVGVLIALFATTYARFFAPIEYAYIPDAIASFIIGLILFILAIYLFKTFRLRFGASATPHIEQNIKDLVTSINGISEVFDLKTLDMGSSGYIVNMEVKVDPETQVRDLDDITERVTEKLKNRIPAISHVNIEVQADETEEDWGEKFNNLIEEGIQNNVLNRREGKILLNFYGFIDTTVYEVMVPRTEIDCLEKNDTIDDLIELVIETGHTRIPVYDESIDNVLGVIHSKDVFRILHEGQSKEEIKLEDLAREIPIVPENKPVSKMLNEFINNKFQIALVADEHGGIAGLVTIEDLLEEIFGEIWDEYDIETVEIKRIDNNTLLVTSKMDIEDINERYDMDLPTEEFQTIGGYIFGQIGRLPKVKDEIKLGEYSFVIESMSGNKIEYIKIHRPDGIIDRVEEEEKRQQEESSEGED